MNYQMSPKEFAEELFERVDSYCSEREGHFSYTNCIANSSPNDLEELLEDEEDLQKIWENSDTTFKELAKKEYENLWSEASAVALAEELKDLLEVGFINLYEFEPIYLNKYGNPYRENIDNDILVEIRIDLLEKYKKFLDKFADVIAEALKRQEPLSPDELREYLLKFYETVRIDYKGYFDPIEDYVIDYSELNKAGKLVVLSELLFGIDNVLDEIDSSIKEYNEWLEKHELEQEQ